MVSELGRRVAEKVDRLRSLIEGDREFLVTFPAGVALDETAVLDGYREQIRFLIGQGEIPETAGDELDGLVLPPALVELYSITAAPNVEYIELFGDFDKGEIMDADGQVHRFAEHWLEIGLFGNDKFMVDLVSGQVMYSDQYFWRYGEPDSSRIVASDALVFFDECVTGPRYREFLETDEIEDPNGWYQFLRANGLA